MTDYAHRADASAVPVWKTADVLHMTDHRLKLARHRARLAQWDREREAENRTRNRRGAIIEWLIVLCLMTWIPIAVMWGLGS